MMTGVKGGQKYIDTIDVNSPDYVREQYRPAEVKQDVRQMAERKRVNEILKSKQFRDELEDVVVDKIKCSSPSKASIVALQQASELKLPQARLRHGAVFGRIETSITPINDLASESSTQLERGEKFLRCKLASCYRLIDQYHWSQSVHPTYISAKVNQNDFLISPGTVPFSLLTAKQLIKLNQEGQPISGPSGVDSIASTLHAATYLANENLKSVLLVRTNAALLMASLDTGLLPLSHDSIILGKVPTVVLNDGQDVTDQLIEAFKVANKAVLLKGIGALVYGDSVEEVFINGRKLMGAIDVQLRTAPVGLDNLVLPSDDIQRKIANTASRKQKRNEIEFEALMRHLENAGHKTGYMFRESLFRKVENKVDKVNSEVELPPTSVSIGYMEDDERPRECKPSGKFTEWLNSPNAYKKEEIEVPSGTPQNKKITRWVPESSPAGTLIKIDNPNQFAPVGTDPNEVKAKVKQIRKEYYDENITSGPQSKILGGLTWEEAEKIKAGNVASGSDTIITVGAASRGIIQKGHQNQGSLYKTYYAPNPFENMTEDEVEAYKQEVDKKSGKSSAGVTDSSMMQYGEDEDNIVPGPDGRLISTDERLQQIKQQHQAVELHEAAPTTAVVAAVVPAPVTVNGEVNEKPLKSPTSPTKSTSSGDATAPELLSGNEEKGEVDSGTEKKKKKKGFRIPSFSSKKKDKKEK